MGAGLQSSSASSMCGKYCCRLFSETGIERLLRLYADDEIETEAFRGKPVERRQRRRIAFRSVPAAVGLLAATSESDPIRADVDVESIHRVARRNSTVRTGDGRTERTGNSFVLWQ